MRRYWLHLEVAVPDLPERDGLLGLAEAIGSATQDLGIYVDRFLDIQTDARHWDVESPEIRTTNSVFAARRELELKWNRWIPTGEIVRALCDRLDLEEEVELVGRITSPVQILELLSAYEPPKIAAQVIATLPASLVVSDGSRTLLEALIKARGGIWTIHKTDGDTWPSNPHAHDYDANEKLDLRTGEVYYPARKNRAKVVRRFDRETLKELFYPRLHTLIPTSWLVD